MSGAGRRVHASGRGWRVALLAALLAAGLAACGGGGGGGGGVAQEPVTPTNDIGASLTATSVVVERDLQERGATADQTVSLIVLRAPAQGYYYRIRKTQNAITFVGNSARAVDQGMDLQIALSSPGVLPVGTYNDTVTLDICLDAVCAQPALGSPFVVAVRLTVGYFAPSHPTLAAQPVASSVTLPHDLVDAAYSAALDAVVTVSAKPSPAINVFDLATGVTRSQALLTTPTSVALEPGGLRAVVGHDAAVSVVQLQPTGSPAVMAVQRYAMSIPVGEVVFDGRGRVHAFAAISNWNPMHNLDLATGLVTTTPAVVFQGLYGGVQALLHPSGDRLYVADRELSPSNVYTSVLSGAAPTDLQASPYFGDYPMCGGVWLSVDGKRLYTACGNTFTSSADPGLDMRYAGALALTPAANFSGPYRALALSESPAGSQLLLLEQPLNVCNPILDQLIACFTTVSTYDTASLALTNRRALAPITVGGDRFAQMGRYLFHRSNGRAVLLSELRSAPNPAASIRLSELP